MTTVSKNNPDIMDPLKEAISAGESIEAVRTIMDRASWDKDVVESGILIACGHGQLHIVHGLLEADIDVQSLWGALMVACMNGHAAIANRLLQAGVKVNVRCWISNFVRHMCRDEASIRKYLGASVNMPAEHWEHAFRYVWIHKPSILPIMLDIASTNGINVPSCCVSA